MKAAFRYYPSTAVKFLQQTDFISTGTTQDITLVLTLRLGNTCVESLKCFFWENRLGMSLKAICLQDLARNYFYLLFTIQQAIEIPV